MAWRKSGEGHAFGGVTSGRKIDGVLFAADHLCFLVREVVGVPMGGTRVGRNVGETLGDADGIGCRDMDNGLVRKDLLFRSVCHFYARLRRDVVAIGGERE